MNLEIVYSKLFFRNECSIFVKNFNWLKLDYQLLSMKKSEEPKALVANTRKIKEIQEFQIFPTKKFQALRLPLLNQLYKSLWNNFKTAPNSLKQLQQNQCGITVLAKFDMFIEILEMSYGD